MDYTRQSVWKNPQIVRAAHHGLGRVNAACSGLALGAVTIRDNGSVVNQAAIPGRVGLTRRAGGGDDSAQRRRDDDQARIA